MTLRRTRPSILFRAPRRAVVPIAVAALMSMAQVVSSGALSAAGEPATTQAGSGVTDPNCQLPEKSAPGPGSDPQIVIDNTDEGFSRNGFAQASKAGARDHYGPDYLVSGATGTGGQQWARWTPTITESGTYRVSVRWSSFENRPAAVPISVVTADGTTRSTTIDERVTSVTWYALGEYEFAAGTGNSVTLTDAGGPNTTADAVKFVRVQDEGRPYRYVDDFDDERAKTSPSHWIESNLNDDWAVARHGRDQVYRHRGTDPDSAVSWLHVFEQDVDVSADLKVNQHSGSNAAVQLAVRYNSDEAQVVAGYDLIGKRWYIKDRRGADFAWETLAESTVMPLPARRATTVRVKAVNSTVELYLDGADEPLLRTAKAQHKSPGRVALTAIGTDAWFDNVDLSLLSGQGRVEDNVLEYTLQDGDGVYREGATVVAATDGDILIRHRTELFRSTDSGATFSPVPDHGWPANPHAHHSILRLQSGKLLSMVAENVDGSQDFDVPFRFRAMQSSDDGDHWTPAGLTWEEYREGLPGVAEMIVMNDKLTQTSSGRIFYAVTARLNDGAKYYGHKMQVYFSDDDGQSWQKSEGDSLDYADSWISYAEGKVVETATGRLRLYVPYQDSLVIRHAVSDDNGVTWHSDAETPGLVNARSSFGVATDLSCNTPVHYMVWVMNDNDDHSTTFLPRSRLALAMSTDGSNWHYLMDLDRWVSPLTAKYQPITQFVDPGITVTDDYIYVTAGRSEMEQSVFGHNDQRLRVYRVDRDSVQPYAEWPTEF